MEIAIADRDKTTVWSIPGSSIYLTYEAPGPLDIDLSKLNSQQQKILSLALGRGIIVGKNTEELMGLLGPKIDSLPAKAYANVDHDVYTARPVEVQNSKSEFSPEKIQDQIKEMRELRAGEITVLLNKHVQTVRKGVTSLNISDLRIALELETKGKARKAVITAINDMIAKINSEIAQNIARNESTYVVPERVESLQITMVEDTEFKDIKIKVGANDK